MTVSGQKFLDANRVRRMLRPDEHDVSEPAGNQHSTTEKERSNEDSAQFRIGLEEREELVTLDFYHFALLPRTKVGQRSPPGEHRYLTGKPSWLNDPHRR